MLLTPSTEVRLLKGVPFVKDSGHVRTFTSLSQQDTYFRSLAGKEINCTYVNTDEALRVDGLVEEYYGYNYLAFKNKNVGDKTIYAFIDSVSMISNGTTGIHYTIDSWQTFMFDLTYGDSYIEREHANDSLVNTQEENIAYGDIYRNTLTERHYPYKLSQVNNTQFSDMKFALLIARESLNLEDAVPNIMTGIEQPLFYYLIPFYDKYDRGQWWYGNTASVNNSPISSLGQIFREAMENPQYVNSIVALHLLDFVPINITLQPTQQEITADYNVSSPQLNTLRSGFGSLTLARITDNQAISKMVVDVAKNKGIPSYGWNKLKQYPYTYIEVTDNQGNTMKVDPLHLNGSSLQINARGNISTQHKTVYSVLNYKGMSDDISNSIINSSLTTLPILHSELAAYIRSSANSDRLAIATSVAQSGISVATGNPSLMGSTMGGTLNQVLALQAKRKDIDNRPPSIGAQGNNATYDYGNGNIGLYIKWWTITDEYATILSQYFNKFGYAINKVKKPNRSTRRYWNYVKTIDAMIFANIPQNYLENIKSMFNNGVTLWHDSDIGNYSRSNTEV